MEREKPEKHDKQEALDSERAYSMHGLGLGAWERISLGSRRPGGKAET